jgi:hypothetical protein
MYTGISDNVVIITQSRQMSLFTKIGVEKRTNTIVLEDYGTQPVLLQSVRKESSAR